MPESATDRSETDANRDDSLRLPKFLADRKGVPTSPELVRVARKQYRALKKLSKEATSVTEACKVHAEMTRLLRVMKEHADKIEDNELADVIDQLGVSH